MNHIKRAVPGLFSSNLALMFGQTAECMSPVDSTLPFSASFTEAIPPGQYSRDKFGKWTTSHPASFRIVLAGLACIIENLLVRVIQDLVRISLVLRCSGTTNYCYVDEIETWWPGTMKFT